MPELPEIEHLRQSLQPILLPSVIASVRLDRPDIVTFFARTPARSHQLLRGARIERLLRHGKNLAIVAEDGRVLTVHCGMTGQMLACPGNARPTRCDHIHCTWTLDTPTGPARLFFRDPRRFGGLATFPTVDALHDHWGRLGPDALTISVADLTAGLANRNRPIKSALLDQGILAGVGNIYADEALFLARIHPMTSARDLDAARLRTLARSLRTILGRAVRSGGSTIRDYRDANGDSGTYADRHHVYGHGGEPCPVCTTTLEIHTVAQRTTVACPQCQL